MGAMMMVKEFRHITTDADMCESALESAIFQYKDEFKAFPWFIVCGKEICFDAERSRKGLAEMFPDCRIISYMEVIVVHAFPKGAWFVSGEEGVIYSEGV